MSSYDNVVGGKLKLKGKALDVAGGVKKKKKKNKRNQDQLLQVAEDDISAGWFIFLCSLINVSDSNYFICVMFSLWLSKT